MAVVKFMKGQTLIEALIALSVGALVLSAIAISVVSSLNNAQFSKNQNSATQYAQEGMEIVRNTRDNDWNIFKNLSGSYCLDKNSTTLFLRDGSIFNGCSHTILPSGNSSPQNVDIFARQVEIIQNSPDCGGTGQTKATVKVSWADGKCTSDQNVYCHNVTLSNCFTDINVKPTL